MYFMIVNIVLQKLYRANKRNGVTSEGRKLAVSGYGFIPNAYNFMCLEDTLKGIDRAKSSFIQSAHHIKHDKLLRLMLSHK